MTLHFLASGAGEPLVLLHGLFGSLDNLGGINRDLQQDFRTIAMDLPDHGKSPWSPSFNYQTYARAVIEQLAELGIAKAAFMGHSMGGKVAMQIALQDPQRVSKLIVADIAPVAYEPRHTAVMNGLTAVPLATITSRKDAAEVMAQHIKIPAVSQFLLRSLYRTTAGNFAWRFNLQLIQRDYQRMSAGLDNTLPFDGPTLFIKGGLSDYLLPQHQGHIHQLFPMAKVTTIPDVGHWLHAEKPMIFAELVRAFLQNPTQTTVPT